jgi:hypothetical protein
VVVDQPVAGSSDKTVASSAPRPWWGVRHHPASRFRSARNVVLAVTYHPPRAVAVHPWIANHHLSPRPLDPRKFTAIQPRGSRGRDLLRALVATDRLEIPRSRVSLCVRARLRSVPTCQFQGNEGHSLPGTSHQPRQPLFLSLSGYPLISIRRPRDPAVNSPFSFVSSRRRFAPDSASARTL